MLQRGFAMVTATPEVIWCWITPTLFPAWPALPMARPICAVFAIGVMRMRQVPWIELPAQSVVALRHGGPYHLMLMDLTQPLKDGDRFT